MVQDSTGFLWFGTYKGLDRFDGRSIRVFMYDPRFINSIPENTITALLIDSKKRLLIGTTDGISVYDERTCSFQPLNVTGQRILPPETPVSCMKEDVSGNLWVGNKNGLRRISLSSGNSTLFTSSPADSQSLSSNRIRALLIDKSNTIWIGTNNGLNNYNLATGTFKRYKNDDTGKSSLNHKLITCLYEDRHGTIWVGTNGGGFFEYLPEQDCFKQYWIDIAKKKNPYNVSSNAILCIFEDHEGKFWVGSEEGLMLFDRENNQCTSFKHNPSDQHSLPNNIVMTVTEDRSRNLWITTPSGVCKLIRRPKGFDYIFDTSRTTTYSNLNNILGLIINHDGNLVSATREAGLRSYSLQTHSFTQYPSGYNTEHGITSTLAWSVFEDKDSNLWIGTGWGLNRQKNGETTFERFDPNDKSYPLPGSNIINIIQDHEGILWFGTENGIATYNTSNKQWKRWSNDARGNEKLPGKYVDYLFEDSKFRLWLVLDTRLYLFDRAMNTFNEYSLPTNREIPFAVHEFSCITESKTGTLLFGTDFGLVEFDLQVNSITLLTKDNGLPDNVIESIVEDINGNVWIATTKGLAFWNRQSNSISTYKEEDGVDNTDFTYRSVCKASNGILYFGTTNGIIVVNPSEIQKNKNIPNVVFTSFRLFNKETALDPDIAVRNQLDIQYNDYVISFEVAALEFTAPHENKFMYMLEGFNQSWVDNENEQLISFANLDPGSYILRVKASNNDGIWNEQGASLAINVSPPYWLTWWFLSLSFLILGGISFGLGRSRYVYLKQTRLEREAFSHRLLAETEEERKRISSELHDSIGQQLLIIKNMSELGIRKSKILEDAQNRFREISSLSETTVKQLREISHNLRPVEIDRFGVWQAIRSLALQVEETFELRFTIAIEDIDTIFSKEAQMHIFRIVQESVNNILKHSKATEATIKVFRKDYSIHLLVIDNGKGFIEGKKKGIGFSSMHARAGAIQSQLFIETTPERGTQIHLVIPATTKSESL